MYLGVGRELFCDLRLSRTTLVGGSWLGGSQAFSCLNFLPHTREESCIQTQHRTPLAIGSYHDGLLLADILHPLRR